ncbi:hypothetical protein K491DRAFT_723209 [Lophiostoma macrostomum CBS 122681]|uniref:DUF218 domain-containing protein n=1 Tax=Lophiostoma macrostomum CBS 122681 TaxID=1314788 RepID=A0A6A6SL28_9PLEO|nr:hypothetical protein K491DRAFT_723209 [Lophiostoma macrostomum CBS 122681]
MAPATPSRRLPKSNFHRTLASDGPVSAAPLDEAAPHRGAERQASNFTHPEHSVPPRSYHEAETLVIVCCHAIFHPDASSPTFPLSSPFDESNWHLASFQRSDPETGKPGEHETFLGHISAGMDTLTSGAETGGNLLVFSGGATKAALTPLSEARSYYNAALALAIYSGQHGGGDAAELFDQGRILLEERATDSFQNLLFSIVLFRQITGHYPKDIRIITHAFKSKRFLDLHGPAISWPSDKIRVQGIDPIMSEAEYHDTVSGEERFGYKPFEEDCLGTGELLSRKRSQRGWKAETARELGANLEESVQQLLQGKHVKELPWSEARFEKPERLDSLSAR